ncbi:MAG: prepilin-type N-terminal cleavage/methylation domain-containing protein [Candidatus Berkelbacteria bacterium]
MKNKKAFTLVEVLVATVILVVVIGGIVAVESGNIKFSVSTKYRTQANGAGQAVVSVLKSLGDLSLVGGSSSAGGDCKDPNTCNKGIYYVDNSNNLKSCSMCKIGNADGTWSAEAACPLTITDTQKAVCTDSGAQTSLDGKNFSRTVIIP